MPFTFPIDSNSKAGAVKATPDGNDFYVPTNPTLYNGTTFDKFVNNQDLTIFSSATRTSTTTSPNFTNYNAKGIMFWLDVTAASGTGGLTLYLDSVDPVSGKAYQLNSGAITLTAIGTYVFQFYPGVTASNQSANMKQAYSFILPRTWHTHIFHADATNYTYSLGASLIL